MHKLLIVQNHQHCRHRQKLNLPEPVRFELSNGLKVVFIEKHEVPLIQLNIAVNSGLVDEPKDKQGISSFVMDMLDEGAAGKTALELSDEIDFLGVELNTTSDFHTSFVELHTPLSKFDASLKIVSDYCIKTRFSRS